MAQITDDCFAFSGPLLPLKDMERLIAERVAAVHHVEERKSRIRARRGQQLEKRTVGAIR